MFKLTDIKKKFSNFLIKLPFSSTKKNLDHQLVFALQPAKIPNWQQLKHVSHFLSSKEIITIKILMGIIFVSALSWGFLFYQNHVQIIPARDGEYIEALVGSPQFINPLFSSLNDVDADLTNLIFAGLLKYNKDEQQFTFDLAESYEISEDQKIYTFRLRDNLRWQDDEPLTAHDVVFTIKTIQNPEVKSPLITSFVGVIMEAPDNRTVVFTLPEPYDPFLSLLTVGILPRHVWEDVNPVNIHLAQYNLKQPIGAGLYQAEKIVVDNLGNIKSYHLTLNDNYHLEKPFIKNFVLKFFDSFQEAIEALKIKEVQGVAFAPVQIQKELAFKESIHHWALKLPQYDAIFLNQKNNTALAKIEVREALTIALDRQKLLEEILNNQGTLISTPIPPDYAQAETNLNYEFNIAKAHELLKKAGFAKNDEQEFYQTKKTNNQESENNDFTITLTYVDSEQNNQIAEFVKNQWHNIGIKTTLISTDSITMGQNIIKGRNYQALLYGIALGVDPDPYPFWHSSQINYPGLNLAGFNNKEADILLEDARKLNAQEQKNTKYKEFQQILFKNFPTIFLFQPQYDYLIDKKVKGIKIGNIITPQDRFNNLSQWYIKTEKKFKLK